MEINNNVNLTAGMFAFNKAKDVKSHEILSALGMTAETQKAQQEIDETIKQEVAKTTNKGNSLDIQA
ncbi:MAG: hypothetical protein DSY40_02320 [Nautilia sp.]|nr:MAG: hypothetical protein DSY40_02320 [Nautilia sp.]